MERKRWRCRQWRHRTRWQLPISREPKKESAECLGEEKVEKASVETPEMEASAKIVVETDETFPLFKEALADKGASETWTAKFAKDAEAMAEMSVHDWMNREVARHFFVAALEEKEDVLSALDAADFEAVKKGVVARRWQLLDRMTPVEQRAYKPKNQ